ncbi:hypothetical protein ACHAXT_008502 [Thalassiosira profunda]
MADHRGVGDTRTLTRKGQSSPATSSLAEEEQRQRPLPTASTGQTQVSDHRDPGDTRTLTRKAAAASPPAAASLSEDEQRQRPVPSAGKDDAAKSDQLTTVAADDPTSGPSPLSTLLKEERRSVSSLVSDNEAAASAPVATLPPSSLQTLLQGDNPVAPDKPTATSTLSSLLRDERRRRARGKTRSPADDEREEWWNERPRRPEGYVQHTQPMNSAYLEKHEAPKDYGNVVEVPAEADDDDEVESS